MDKPNSRKEISSEEYSWCEDFSVIDNIGGPVGRWLRVFNDWGIV